MVLKIVLTGGPCAGKTKVLNKLTDVLEKKGFKVFTVFEAATALILNGIRPCDELPLPKFQEFVLDMQLKNEEIFNNVKKYYDPEKIIIIFDRAIMDGCAYIDKKTLFEPMLEKRGLTINDIYSRYDIVIHLVTAADNQESHYKWNNPESECKGNNAARSETPEEARLKDKKTRDAWMHHPNVKVIDSTPNFSEKFENVLSEIFKLTNN